MFWFTPIVYPVNIIPERFHYLLELSPTFRIVDSYHRMIVYGQPLAIGTIVYMVLIIAILFPLAMFMFRRASPEMVDVL
jgi:lipopolysaccharide transport system permease protein